MADINPKDPNQSVETYVTKKSLTGSSIPVMTPKTINPSRKFLLFNKINLKINDLRDSFSELNNISGIFYLYVSKENIHTLETDEKIVLKIIEIQKTQHLDYVLHFDRTTFNLKNVLLTRSSTPVNQPTTRGGVYFSDKFEFKIKAQVNDSSIIPLLSKSMLVPNTKFEDLKVTTKIQFEKSLKQVTFVVNLTDTMQRSSIIELNMTILRANLENLS